MSGYMIECECGNRMWIADSTDVAQGCCDGCGRTIRMTGLNVASFDPVESVTLPAENQSPAGPTTCVRCGREFRGEWDQYKTPDGIYCHICANQYDGGIIDYEELDKKKAEKGTLPAAPGLFSGWYEEVPESERYESPVRQRDRTIVLIGGLAIFIALTLADRFMGIYIPMTPAQATVIGITFGVVKSTLKLAVVLFFTLDYTQRLPNKSLLPNLAAMMLVALPLTLMALIIAMFLPFAGFISAVASLVIISNMYNFGIRELFVYVLYSIVGGILSFSIAMLF